MVKLNIPKLLGQRTAIANASILKRIISFLVDLLIIQLVVFSPFRKAIEKIVGSAAKDFSKLNQIATNPEIAASLTPIIIAIGLLTVIYFIIFEMKMNQTPGKMIFNIYVISENNKLAFWQVLLRSMFLIPIFPFVLLWVIDPFFLLINKKSQRLTEQLSKTRVVKRIAY